MKSSREGWDLSNIGGVSIQISNLMLGRLYDGYYEENFYIELTIEEADANSFMFNPFLKEGRDVYFGFYEQKSSRIFQAKMILFSSEKLFKLKTYRFEINGFPEILPLDR